MQIETCISPKSSACGGNKQVKIYSLTKNVTAGTNELGVKAFVLVYAITSACKLKCFVFYTCSNPKKQDIHNIDCSFAYTFLIS